MIARIHWAGRNLKIPGESPLISHALLGLHWSIQSLTAL